jgi:DNA-binding beta-propeller fold protein YncE
MRSPILLITSLLAACACPSARAVEPLIASTLEDGSFGIVLPTPAVDVPNPAQVIAGLPVGSRPHGAAFLGANEALFADFALPRLLRVALDAPATATIVALSGRSNGNGTLTVDPSGRYAISIGQTNALQPVGEAVVVDFGVQPPQATPIAGGLRVLGFVTAAVDFSPDGRAFICHTTGVSVLAPPYTGIAFTMPFPAVVQSPTMCRLTRDGRRLFVTRMLSETAPSVNAIRTTTSPFSAASQFTEIPAPADVQGLGPMVVSPDGEAVLVGQQFLFPPSFVGTRARAFIVRAPYGAESTWSEIPLPDGVRGETCFDGPASDDCPGFEHIELSDDGSLAILTGNSSDELAGAADSVPLVYVRDPFDDANRVAQAVQLAPGATTPGRGTGAVRFRPTRIFRDGIEAPP